MVIQTYCQSVESENDAKNAYTFDFSVRSYTYTHVYASVYAQYLPFWNLIVVHMGKIKKFFTLTVFIAHCIIFQATLRDPLPPVLAKMDEMPRDRYFDTTNGTTHDHKFLGGPYGNGKSTVYKKAPALYKVNYVKDHAEKV